MEPLQGFHFWHPWRGGGGRLADAFDPLPEKASDYAAAANGHNLREVEIEQTALPLVES